ncbi:hypothetical protein [Senegalia massiliensis]|uniref:Uncharacterized protein n=1 Tax=Senegalia massiliensis TaxID=1720316 RepID=A0A845R4H0_9CLOT|nr:hypothetical protein [Senegalia massiliensis]NBI08312.1 hypothetical protein [Senegalia massiliensis]
MKKSFKNVIIIILTLFLQDITYKIGGFNYGNAPILSVETFYDFVIFAFYYISISYILDKTIMKNDEK